MDTKDQILEEEIEKLDVVRCNYCNTELKREEACIVPVVYLIVMRIVLDYLQKTKFYFF